VNVLVSSGDAFHVDTLDLYSARQRAAFTKQAAEELNVKEETLKRDLRPRAGQARELQDEQIRAALTPKPAVAMSEEDRTAALALLRDPKLLDRIRPTSSAAAWWAKRPTSWSPIWPWSRGIWIAAGRGGAIQLGRRQKLADGRGAAFVPEEERVSTRP
jgi:hypothetical protein